MGKLTILGLSHTLMKSILFSFSDERQNYLSDIVKVAFFVKDCHHHRLVSTNYVRGSRDALHTRPLILTDHLQKEILLVQLYRKENKLRES